MPSTSNLKNDHISVLYYWNKGIRSASLIHRETNIPLSTIYYNIDRLKQTGSLKHRGENGRPRVLGGKERKAIGQYIRYNNEITLREIKENLSTMHHKSVSTSTISRHLHEYGYKNVLPQSTHILTSDEKERRVQWAKKHKNEKTDELQHFSGEEAAVTGFILA
jgi:transposase